MGKSTATRSASDDRQAAASLAQRRQSGAGALLGEVGQRTGAGFGLGSEKAAASQRLVDNSPRVAAQRKQIESAFGMPVQRQGAEEELLQGKFGAAQLKQEPAPRANNTGLSDNLKAGIEKLSGMSMDDVKVHYNSSQPAQLNALAYAQGTDIHLAAGQEQHLPHEAWHVVQQAQGRVKPTMQMRDGVPVNDDEGLEHEADVMGRKALQAKAKKGSDTSNVIQMGGKKGNKKKGNKKKGNKKKGNKKGGGGKSKAVEIGGALLSWDPYGERTLVRWATENEHKQFVKDDSYAKVKHKGSTNNAVWFATEGTKSTYVPDFAKDRPWKVTVSVEISRETRLVNFEAQPPKWKGEAKHPDEVIVKENEVGAYGIGRSLIDRLRPAWTPLPKKGK